MPRRTGGRLQRSVARRVSIVVALVVAGLGLGAETAFAEVVYSQFDPPPLCSENTDPDFHYCIAQAKLKVIATEQDGSDREQLKKTVKLSK